MKDLEETRRTSSIIFEGIKKAQSLLWIVKMWFWC